MAAQRKAVGYAKRRTSRGAALVESIIVSSLLMTFMAGGLFLHRLYAAQHRALMQARLAAWSQAMKGCNSAVDLNAIWREAGNADAPTQVDTESTPAFFGAVGHTSGSASQSASASARAGGDSHTLSASNSVACNEVANDDRGDVAGLIGYISGSVLPHFF